MKKTKKAGIILIATFFALVISPAVAFNDAYATKNTFEKTVRIAMTDAKVEVIKTIPLNDNGSYQHFVKICADENNRLERPNVIVSSDTETYREQLDVNLPPTFCTLQEFIIDAQNPDSINIRIIDWRPFLDLK